MFFTILVKAKFVYRHVGLISSRVMKIWMHDLLNSNLKSIVSLSVLKVHSIISVDVICSA